VPLPGPAVEPPEIVHQHSVVLNSLIPHVSFEIEWTGDTHEQHYVFIMF
jgi:hypothetical protein